MKNLSKSKIIRGKQCPKSLWLYLNHYDWQDEIDASQQAIFDTGNNVGGLAQQLFPKGIDATKGEKYANTKTAQKTQELIEAGQKVIYEATFISNGVLVAVDILVFQNNTWYAYEVKSSTEVKPVHLDDAAVQWKVIIEAGIELQKIHLVHIDNSYVRKGDLDLNQLFAVVDLTDEVLEKQMETEQLIADCKSIAQSKEMPQVDIGPHCSNPYGCSFAGHCWQHVPEYSVFNISRLKAEKKWELYLEGILKLEDIPEDYPLSANQQLQIHAEINQETLLDKGGITQFLKEWQYPLYYLDYETINPAIPPFDNSSPYQQFPFQYSLHVQDKPNAPCTHHEYLAATDGKDPREEFIQQLIKDCGTKGSIVVYNIGFEKGKTEKLAEQFPKYAKALLALCDRMVDLMVPFQQKWIYTPDMRGSYSIKKTLPALVPELSYDTLNIKEGGTASSTFANYFNAAQPLPAQLKKDLLDYCKMDTWAMVRLLEVLCKRAGY